MRLIKMLGLAAALGLMLAATVGPSPAAAESELEKVVWCRVRVHMCPEPFPAGTNIYATTTSALFLSNLGNVTCTASEMSLANSTLLVHGEVTGLSFSGCALEKGGECKVTANNLTYLFKGELQANNVNYGITFTEKNPNGQPQVTIECPLLKCTLGANEVFVAALLSSPTEKLNVLQEFIAVKGALCPKNVVMHAEYLGECAEGEVKELKPCWVKMEA